MSEPRRRLGADERPDSVGDPTWCEARVTAIRIRWHVNAPRTTVQRGRRIPHHPHVRRTHHTGDTTAHSDTCHGRCTRLVSHERVVLILEFETGEPASADERTITYTPPAAETGADADAVHDGLPDAIASEDNEPGLRISPAELAAMAEAAR
ncbi:hypothetical protein [Nocardia gipuzkoensis]